MPDNTLRIMSWNIRDLGRKDKWKTYDAIENITEIILNNRIDILCIQEVDPGSNYGGIDQKISEEAYGHREVGRIHDVLDQKDPDAGWKKVFSNSNAQTHADAYGFLWKTSPKKSRQGAGGFRHDEPVIQINCIQDPQILFVEEFPGRRPSGAKFEIECSNGDNQGKITIDLISYHAKTPTNQYAIWSNVDWHKSEDDDDEERSEYDTYTLEGYPCAGRAVEALGESLGDGEYFEEGKNTILCGDFNFDLTKSGLQHNPSDDEENHHNDQVSISAETIYKPITDNTDRCIFDTVNATHLKTTYTSSKRRMASPETRHVSSYDNIYFTPSQNLGNTPSDSARVDFISDLHEKYRLSWPQAFSKYYATMHSTSGLSDHMPVWAEFRLSPNIDSGEPPAKRRREE